MSRPGDRRRWLGWGAALLLAAAAALYLTLLSNDIGDLLTDSSLYLLLGKALAAGEGFRNIYLPGQPLHVAVPPGFPWLISLLMRVAGSALWPMHLLVVLHLLAALWLCYRWLRATDWGAWALLVLALTLVNLRWIEWSLPILPLFPSVCYTFAAFLCVPRYAASPSVWNRWYWASVACILAATFLWMPGGMLAPAALAVLLTGGAPPLRRRKALALAVAVSLPVGAWLLYCAVVDRAQAALPLAPFYVMSGGGSYLHTVFLRSWLDASGGWVGPADLWGRVLASLREYAGIIPYLLYPGPYHGLYWLAAAGIVGWMARCRRGAGMAEWYLAAYALLMLCTPFTVERYVVPVIPLLYAYILWGWVVLGRWVARRTSRWGRRWLRAVRVLTGAMACVAPALVFHTSLIHAQWRLAAHASPVRLPLQTSSVNWAHLLERRIWGYHPDEMLGFNDFIELHLWINDRDPSTDATIFSIHPRLGAWFSGHQSLCFPARPAERQLLAMVLTSGARYIVTTESEQLAPLFTQPDVQAVLARCELLQRRPHGAVYRLPAPPAGTLSDARQAGIPAPAAR